MIRRLLVSTTLVVAGLTLSGGGAADAKGVCLERALEQGYAFRNEFGAIVYRPHLPTAEDRDACAATGAASAVVVTPEFTG